MAVASVAPRVRAAWPCRFIRDTVREGLDLTAIFSTYGDERGFPPYHPAMMVALLLYGYSQGVYSSRRLARSCEERMDFMAVTGLNRPDFRTISDFRKRHLPALSELFLQVLLDAVAGADRQCGSTPVPYTTRRDRRRRHRHRDQPRRHARAARSTSPLRTCGPARACRAVDGVRTRCPERRID